MLPRARAKPKLNAAGHVEGPRALTLGGLLGATGPDAETEGFEPSRGLLPYRLSRAAH